MADARVGLPDGRQLGYAGYGAADGTPVLYFHGGLSSRLDIAFGDAACQAARVRLLALDRPGIGLSSPHAGASLADWVADVRHFAAALGLSRFGLLAWSAGTPYALACAAGLGPVVTRTGIAAGIGPLRAGAVRELGLAQDRLLYPLCRRSPRLAAAALRLAGCLPAAVAQRSVMAQLTSPSDREIYGALTPHEATAFFYEAIRQGPEGAIADYRITGGDWGFELRDIPGEVLLWHGEEDTLAPPRRVRALADAIPRARLTMMRSRGHFLLRRELPGVLAAITEGAYCGDAHGSMS